MLPSIHQISWWLFQKTDGKTRWSFKLYSSIEISGKSIFTTFTARISDPRLQYQKWTKTDQFVEFEIDWWIAFLCKKDSTRCSFDYFLRRPDQVDHQVYTDAAETKGVGGLIDDTYAF